MTGDEGTVHIATLLGRAPSMEDFNMAESRFTSVGAVMLAKGLSEGTSPLVKLDLTDNNVNEKGGIALAEMIHKQPGLRHLNLEATGLWPNATGAVMSALVAKCPQSESTTIPRTHVF